MDMLLILALAAAIAIVAILFIRSREVRRRIIAETKLEAAERTMLDMSAQRETAILARISAQTELAATQQQLAAAEKRMAEFERVQQEMLTSAKAAVLETGTVVSSKLLEDHK